MNINDDNTSIKTTSEDGNQSYWKKWYLGVLLFLIVQIIIFYFITVEFK